MKQNIEKELCRDFSIGEKVASGLCEASFVYFKKSRQGSAGILPDGLIIQK